MLNRIISPLVPKTLSGVEHGHSGTGHRRKVHVLQLLRRETFLEMLWWVFRVLGGLVAVVVLGEGSDEVGHPVGRNWKDQVV